MSKKNPILLGLAALFLAGTASASMVPAVNQRATLFEKDSKFAKTLFRFEKDVTDSGGTRTVLCRYVDPTGKPALEEKMEYGTDGGLVKYWRMQHQIDEETRMERKGDKIEFYRREKDKKATDSEKWTDRHLTTDQITGFILANWAKLVAGEELDIRLLIPSRMDSVGFTIEKSGKAGMVNGMPTTVFEMGGASMIIRAAVNPIYFYYSNEAKPRLLLIDGRMPVKIVKKDGEYNDIVGELLFETLDPAKELPKSESPSKKTAAAKSK